MTYRDEFPDFDYELPVVPGLTDQSWHNDVCPHLSNADDSLDLWCDYADISKREFDTGKTFSLMRNDERGDGVEVLAESDNLDEILVALAKHQLGTAVPVDLLNMVLDMRVTASEAQFGKATYSDVCDHARKLAAELGLRASIGLDDHSATWSR